MCKKSIRGNPRSIERKRIRKKLREGDIDDYYTIAEFADKAFGTVVKNINISPLDFYDLTPSEINELLYQIKDSSKNSIDMKKAELEATMHAVTLGIANLKKKGNKYTLFEKEVKKQSKTITKEEKAIELAELERLVV